MKRTSLEQKILCAQADRVADAEVAKVFLEMAAMRPLIDYFRKNWRIGRYVMNGIGKDWTESLWNGESDGLVTYGRLCEMLVRKREKGEPIDNLLLRAAACRYVKDKRGSVPIKGDSGTAKTDDREGSFQRESLNDRDRSFRRESLDGRLERAKKAAKEEKAQKEQQGKMSLSGYYAWLEEEPEASAEGVAFFVNHINMREYFQALSLLTGEAGDAKIPEILPSSENLTVEEALDEEGLSDGAYQERIYVLLIEPFAKIYAKRGTARYEGM